MDPTSECELRGPWRTQPRSAALAAQIAADKANGWLPLACVATVGTTSMTSIDPVPAIADICNREGVWLHVDGAYGGMLFANPCGFAFEFLEFLPLGF